MIISSTTFFPLTMGWEDLTLSITWRLSTGRCPESGDVCYYPSSIFSGELRIGILGDGVSLSQLSWMSCTLSSCSAPRLGHPCARREAGMETPRSRLFAISEKVLSRHLLCALQARPCGLLKPTALDKIPGRFQLHQEALPHLPVPPLQQTLDRYLLALQPIISPEELSHTQELVAEFRKPGGVGERLQKGLERRARKTENWVGQGSGPSSH